MKKQPLNMLTRYFNKCFCKKKKSIKKSITFRVGKNSLCLQKRQLNGTYFLQKIMTHYSCSTILRQVMGNEVQKEFAGNAYRSSQSLVVVIVKKLYLCYQFSDSLQLLTSNMSRVNINFSGI